MNGHFEIGELGAARYFLGIAVVVGLLFFFIGPDENSSQGALLRLLQWQLQTIIPMFLAVAIHIALSRLGYLHRFNSWVALTASGIIAILLFTPIALLIDVVIANEPIVSAPLHSMGHELSSVGPPILICWLAINLPFKLGYRLTSNQRISVPVDQTAITETKLGSALNELLPADIRGEVIYLKSELHYLQVVTVHGKALVLYSLKNAVEEFAGHTGFQPHRSYWVNRRFIKTLTKNGREGMLTLTTGAEIPVSRANMRVLLEKDNHLLSN